MSEHQYDFVVIGAGIIGINVATELKTRFPESAICVLEKEQKQGMHASGRNSGVLHAGFYYTADSVKAKFCRDGNIALSEYIKKNKLNINQCGKVVVCKDENDLNNLGILYERGLANGVPLEWIDAKQLEAIEPLAKTYKSALYSPSTSAADCNEVIAKMRRDAEGLGVIFKFNEAFLNEDSSKIISTNHRIKYKYLINCAGLYADKIAKKFGFSKKTSIIPFKGLYLKLKKKNDFIGRHIYPVPNIDQPFLGTHFTCGINNILKIGPTAIPALWLEQYNLLDNFRFNEFLEICKLDIKLFFKSPFNFKKLALKEYLNLYKPRLVNLSNELVSYKFKSSDFEWVQSGIRAQLLNLESKELEMDFVIEEDSNSLHVLNAVSPAWTCSIPFSSYIVDLIENKIN